MKPVRLIRGFLTVGFWTLASRILGFVRDIVIAALLGAGPVAEAFLVAFALPNMFRRFFAEGAFNMAFVPMFAKKLEADKDPLDFARDAFAGLAGVLILLTVVAQFVMPWMVLAMASGFAGDERLDLATAFGRIAFPYILFISLAALLSGVLNATGRFAAAAAAPVLLNVLFIGTLWIASILGWDYGLTLAWTVPLAGIAQLALVWVAAARAGFALTPKWPVLTPDLKRLAIIALPAVLTAGTVQINLLVGRQIASFFDGAIAWLSYADRLYQLPLGVVGIAIGVVLLPELSRRLQAGDTNGGRNAANRAAEMCLALTIPAAVALIVVPLPLVSTLFERGAFTADDSANTALALAIYGLGLPAFVLQKVMMPMYFAREDTRNPFRFALVGMVVNAVLAIGLAPVIGFTSAAVAATVAGWVMLAFLWRGARSMGDAARPDARLQRRLPRICLSAAIMGVCLWGAQAALAPWFRSSADTWALVLLVAFGLVSYFAVGRIVGAFSLADFRGAVRR